jgi:ubiquinone/menaquinone biosynthesis C-methylase UbiE
MGDAAAASGLAELKRRMKLAWMAGDFGQIARLNERGGEEFVERLELKPGMRVLDVACGTGNTAIPAARKGAEVTGLDIAPNLLEQARQRAEQHALEIRFDEGDAEELPYDSASFDIVLSMFGAMFAPRPEQVAAELLRVCVPDGLIAMANWTPEGFVGKMFAVTSQHVPPPPGVPAPVQWGSESVVRERFGSKATIGVTKREILFDTPQSPHEAVEFFRKYFGPTQVAFSRLDANGQEALARDLVQHWENHNEGDANRTIVRLEYLEVLARPN